MNSDKMPNIFKYKAQNQYGEGSEGSKTPKDRLSYLKMIDVPLCPHNQLTSRN